jgi:hypothetical protein
MPNNTPLTAEQLRFHSGPFWEQLQRKADDLTHAFGGRNLTDTERVNFIEQSSYLRGGIEATQELVPQFRLLHREWLERSLASLVSTMHRVESLSATSAEELAELQKEALAIVGLLDAGDQEQAERSIRAMEAQVEQLFALGIQRDVEGRLNRLHALLEAAA